MAVVCRNVSYCGTSFAFVTGGGVGKGSAGENKRRNSFMERSVVNAAASMRNWVLFCSNTAGTEGASLSMGVEV